MKRFTIFGMAFCCICALESAAAAMGAPVKFVAHRGDYPDAPEHSMAAYRNALERGSEVLKLDVHLSKDGVIVLSHDPTFKRTMGWDAKIRDVTWAEIREHAYLLGGKETDERAVSLSEALRFANSIPEFWIDFKYFTPDFCEQVLAEFGKAGIAEDRLMVATYSGDALKYVRDAHPGIRRISHMDFRDVEGKWSISFERHLGVLCAKAAEGEPYPEEVADHIIAYAKTLDLWGVNMLAVPQIVTPQLVGRLHAEGLAVSIAVLRDAETASRYAAHGVDFAVTSNRRAVQPAMSR